MKNELKATRKTQAAEEAMTKWAVKIATLNVSITLEVAETTVGIVKIATADIASSGIIEGTGITNAVAQDLVLRGQHHQDGIMTANADHEIIEISATIAFDGQLTHWKDLLVQEGAMKNDKIAERTMKSNEIQT